jgi:HSP20 family protein
MTNIIKRNKNGNGSLGTMSVMPGGGLVDTVLQSTLNRFFNDDFWGLSNTSRTNQVAPVNIRETDKSYEMEVLAPGFRREDFKVEILNDTLTISLEHKDEQQQNREGYLRQEYSVQSFSRSFTLDDTVDAEKISARYKDGILQLNIPKKEGAQRITKSIEVK